MSENYSLIGTLAFLDPSGANPYLELSKAKPVEILNVPGKSAYELAVDGGFVGTEEEWIDSLQGADGVAVYTFKGDWNNSDQFYPNDVAVYQGSSYVCLLEHHSASPTNPTYWQLIAQKGDDGDPGPSVFTFLGEWVNGNAYATNDVVSYLGSSYVCNTGNTGVQPDNTGYWSLIAKGVASGGTTGQVLKKYSDDPYDTVWGDIPPSLPSGGDRGRIAVKASNTDYDFEIRNSPWVNDTDGWSQYKNFEVTDNGYIPFTTKAIDVRPQEDSPSKTIALSEQNVIVDPDSSGYGIGDGGEFLILDSRNINHQGTSDIGSMYFTKTNVGIGNGTDAIDVRGVAISLNFGNFTDNVNLTGPIQGYIANMNFADGVTNANMNVYAAIFADFMNYAPVFDASWSSFQATPNIGGIATNNNYNGYVASPHIGELQGNAGFLAFNSTPKIEQSGNGSVNGLYFNPQKVSMGVNSKAGNAYGVWVSMDNIDTSAGTKSSLTLQDLYFEWLQPGDNNGYAVEYIDDGTAGAETVGISGQTLQVHMESGVSTASQIRSAMLSNFSISGAVTITVTGVGSNPQTAVSPTNFTGGAWPGQKLAGYFDGDVQITGALSFGGALSVGALNSFAPYTLASGSGSPVSADMLITSPTVAANATLTGADYLGVNTAMLLNVGANASVSTGLLGVAALGLPAVVSMQSGSTVDRVAGAVFAISLDASAPGGTIDRVDLCQAIAIPNGATTVSKLVGHSFDMPFGVGLISSVYGFRGSYDGAYNWFNGYTKIGGADDSIDTNIALEIATQRFFKGPTGTNTDRNALTPTAGCIWFSTTDSKLQVYDGSSWIDLH